MVCGLDEGAASVVVDGSAEVVEPDEDVLWCD